MSGYLRYFLTIRSMLPTLESTGFWFIQLELPHRNGPARKFEFRSIWLGKESSDSSDPNKLSEMHIGEFEELESDDTSCTLDFIPIARLRLSVILGACEAFPLSMSWLLGLG